MAGTRQGAADALPTRWVDAHRARELREASATWPSHDLDPAQVDDLELLADGLFGPLTGYLSRADHDRVVAEGRLANGAGWPDPLTLAVPTDLAGALAPGRPLALRDPEGTMLAVCHVQEVWQPDPSVPSALVGGPVEALSRPTRWTFRALRPSAAKLRGTLDVHDRVLAVPTERALHRADVEEIAGEAARGRLHLLLLQLEAADTPADTTAAITRALRAALPELGVPATLALLPWSRPVGGDRRAALLEHVARALGAERCLSPGRTGADVDAAIIAGDTVSGDATLPGVEEQLRAAFPARSARGFVVFLTGLSGSGKSTIANALRGRLLERGDRRVTLLDGDLVRKHLSKGLGFSQQDRETNVRRIGFVAAEIAHHGGIAVCAPIAPHEHVRREVRALVERGGAGFVLVHVATPLEVCEERDRKGLYAKARAGQITSFTGIDDPYELPRDAELRLDTVDTTPDACARAVLDHLVAAGWLRPEP